jgi:FtsZ-binding cell division protein ZapB
LRHLRIISSQLKNENQSLQIKNDNLQVLNHQLEASNSKLKKELVESDSARIQLSRGFQDLF